MKKAKGQYSASDRKPYHPGKNIPDRVKVDNKTILTLTDSALFDYLPHLLLEPLAGKKERPWFTEHFYFCLPVTFGNQHGFLIRLLYDIIVRWDGSEGLPAVVIHRLCRKNLREHQVVKSHFGSGIVTIQNRWTFRTEPGMNLLVGPPPNFILEGITPMTAVVQTDQLRRDFTLNLKINIANRDIYLAKGTPVGWVLPYPRGVIQNFEVKPHPEGDILEDERETMRHFGISRRDYEKGLPNHLYRKGVDIYGNKFEDHEKMVSGQSATEWRNNIPWPVASLENLNQSAPPLPAGEPLPEERELLESLLDRLKAKSPQMTFDHVHQVYLYIQSARLRDCAEKSIKDELITGGWTEEQIKVIFSLI